MSRKYHLTTADEYMFLKSKVVKLLKKHHPEAKLKIKRVKKQAKKFIRRMREIVEYHETMGWAHPEAQFRPNPNLRESLEALKQEPGKPLLTNPDGTLYEKYRNVTEEGYLISTKGAINPDGTLFETPIMPGSVLVGGGPGSPHSPEKIQSFFDKDDDQFLRKED